MNLPGVCQGCRAPVVWNGKRWRNPGQRNGGHECIHRVRRMASVMTGHNEPPRIRVSKPTDTRRSAL